VSYYAETKSITAERYQQLIDLNHALTQKRPIIAQRKSDLTMLDYTLQKQ